MEVHMSYELAISRANPTCFLFLIDQSGSMMDPIQGIQDNPRKADFIVDLINKTIQTLVLQASKDDGIRRYYQVGALGYGSDVTNLLGWLSSEDELVWIDKLADNPKLIETREKKESDGAGGFVSLEHPFPVWIESVASGRTSMCEALEKAKVILEEWVDNNPNAYPPTIINFTDGEATDGDPTEVGQEIKKIQTTDGEVLMFTLHVSSNQFAKTLFCPVSSEELPDAAAKMMFSISSPLTPTMLAYAKEYGMTLEKGSRAFVYNAGIEALVRMIEIGSRGTENLIGESFEV